MDNEIRKKINNTIAISHYAIAKIAADNELTDNEYELYISKLINLLSTHMIRFIMEDYFDNN